MGTLLQRNSTGEAHPPPPIPPSKKDTLCNSMHYYGSRMVEFSTLNQALQYRI